MSRNIFVSYVANFEDGSYILGHGVLELEFGKISTMHEINEITDHLAEKCKRPNGKKPIITLINWREME